MNIPNWWQFVLLAGAAWRIFQLFAHDDLLDIPRRRFLRLGDDWQREGDPVPSDYRYQIGNFIDCPYCLGLWIAVAWWGAWQIWPHATVVVAVPLALSAGLVALTKVLSE